MIINFSIQNFGSIKETQELSFEADKSEHLAAYYIVPIKGVRLLKLGLIYGANASGKTGILQALQFLRTLVLSPASKKSEPINYEPFLFDSDSPHQNTVLSIKFIQNLRRYDYSVEFNRNAIVRESLNHYNSTKSLVFKRTTDLENQFTRISFGSKIKIDQVFEKTLESNTLWNNTVLGGFLKTNIDFPALREVTDWFSNYLKPLIAPGTNLDAYVTRRILKNEIQKADLIHILRKADLNISEILIREDEQSIPEGLIELFENRFKESGDLVNELKAKGKITKTSVEIEHTVNDEKYNLPFELESLGTKRYYGLAGILSIMLTHSVCFPIDELEASLHPDLFTHFLLSFLMNSKSSQLIATTHNREILNNKDIFRNDAIWFTNKTGNSATELYALSDFDSGVIRDTSNVFNAYKVGKLGAIPKLGDYFIDIADGTK
jgi:AAA15 family ATPase/GTPase